MSETSNDSSKTVSEQNGPTFLSWFLKTFGWSFHAFLFWGFGTFLALIIFRNSWKNSSGFFPAAWCFLMQLLMPVIWILYVICFFIYKWWFQWGFNFEADINDANVLNLLKVKNLGVGTHTYSALLSLIIPILALVTGYIYMDNITSSLYSYLPNNPFSQTTQEKKNSNEPNPTTEHTTKPAPTNTLANKIVRDARKRRARSRKRDLFRTPSRRHSVGRRRPDIF